MMGGVYFVRIAFILLLSPKIANPNSAALGKAQNQNLASVAGICSWWTCCTNGETEQCRLAAVDFFNDIITKLLGTLSE